MAKHTHFMGMDMMSRKMMRKDMMDIEPELFESEARPIIIEKVKKPHNKS